MNTQDERQAFVTWAARNQYDVSEIDTVYGVLFKRQSTENAWMVWISSAKAKDEKLEGCVVVPEAEHKEMAQFKDIYKRAIVNAKKRKNQINWAHVAGLGVGSGRAVELCKELKIDPYATDMNAMLEAARGGNE